MKNLPAVDNITVQKVQSGDSGAFKELVGSLMQPAYFHALGLLGHHEDASDVVQQTFIRVWMNREKIDPERPFYPWFYTILKRLAFNFRRDRTRRNRHVARGNDSPGSLSVDTQFDVSSLNGFTSEWLEPVENSSPEDVFQRKEESRQLATALACLAVGDREVIVLKDLDGYKYNEISELLSIPVGTVMSRLYTARKRLKEQLEKEGYEQ